MTPILINNYKINNESSKIETTNIYRRLVSDVSANTFILYYTHNAMESCHKSPLSFIELKLPAYLWEYNLRDNDCCELGLNV